MAFAGPFNRTGENGADGKNGRDGLDGIDGRNGKNGKDGRDGKDGITKVIHTGSFGAASEGINPQPSAALKNPFLPLTLFNSGTVSDSETEFEDFNMIDLCCAGEDQTEFAEIDLGDYDSFCEAV